MFKSWFQLFNCTAFISCFILLTRIVSVLVIYVHVTKLCCSDMVIIGNIYLQYRSTVMASTMSTSSFLDFLQMLFFKPIANTIGVHVAFYFFGIVCILTSIYVLLVVPETKQRSLHEIYEDLKTKKERQKEIANETDREE